MPQVLMSAWKELPDHSSDSELGCYPTTYLVGMDYLGALGRGLSYGPRRYEYLTVVMLAISASCSLLHHILSKKESTEGIVDGCFDQVFPPFTGRTLNDQG